jgi:hypothetical protein
MRAWSPDSYLTEGRKRGVSDDVLLAALRVYDRIAETAPRVTPLVTLGHLAHVCGVQYAWLRAVVDRSVFPYFTFRLRKRRGGFRTIFVPEHRLLLVQRWINTNVLERLEPLQYAYAYLPGSNIATAAARHCGSRWMIKVDIENFFPSVTAASAYSLFRNEVGFPALLAFELARICTVDGSDEQTDRGAGPYFPRGVGSLPTGAPTSPMISNLVMRSADLHLAALARQNGARYGRYADDLVFTSGGGNFGRRHVSSLLVGISNELRANGFLVNHEKTLVMPPGTRKTFLGLDVTGNDPKIRHELKARLRQHYNFIRKHGPAEHARRRRFASIPALERHLWGLISFVQQVEPDYAALMKAYHDAVRWPVLS